MEKKPLTKCNTPFMMKSLKKQDTEGTYLSKTKVYMTNPKLTSYGIGKIENISPKNRNKTRMSALTTQYLVFEILCRGTGQEKEIKGL